MAKRIPRARSTSYPSDVSDEEWGVVAPYLTLSRLDSPQRTHDLPPWPAVFQQMQRWMRAGCCAALVHDLRVILGVQVGRARRR